MSRESEQDEHWLGGYRRVVVFILLAVIVTTLVMSYRNHREEALAISASLLGEQFAQRAQRLHGRWLDERRPSVLHAEGTAWQFDERGWPLAVLPLQSPSENCRGLWSALLGQEALSMPTLQVLASPDGEGCEFGWEANWLIYRFADGSLLNKS